MKRPKKNPDLAQALADLRDWAWLEAKVEQTGKGQRQWLDVRDWAEGTAMKYRVELPKPSPSNASGEPRGPNNYERNT